MSGIASILNISNKDSKPADVRKLIDPLSFRGKDKINFISEGPLSMLQCMFIATEEDKKEILPSKHIDPSIMIASDSRIDNREELINLLNINNLDLTDSEIIVHAYKRWRLNIGKYLIGAFAIIIYDFDREELFCIRDQIGFRPLYYTLTEDKLIVSSSIDSIKKELGLKVSINKKRIIDYLLFSCGKKDETFFEEIHKLPKASFLSYKDSNLEIKEYYNLNDLKKKKLPFSEDYSKEFKEIFFEVIKSQMRTPNKKIVSALSGGLDSTSITRTLAHLNTDNSIESISAIFKGLKGEAKEKTDELEYMKSAMSKNFKSNFIELKNIGPISSLESSQKYHDVPVSAINGYVHIPMLMKAKELGSKVLFDGFDGDTVISHGLEKLYDYSRKLKYLTLYKERKKVDRIYGFKTSKSWIIKNYIIKPLIPLRIDYYRKFLFNKKSFPGNLFELFTKKVKKQIKGFSYIKNFYGFYPYQYSSSAKNFHIRAINYPIWEYGIEMIETHALEQGIEMRFPFFDLRLIEFCVCLPLEEKNKNGINRHILRKAMKGIVPEKILNRLDKSNIGAFAEKEIREIDHDQFFSSLKQKNILNDIVDFNYFNDVIKKNVEKDLVSGNNDLSRYYLLYSLNYWLESLENT